MPNLGFNSRTERDRWRAGGIVETTSILTGVGPGSYDVGSNLSKSDKIPGYAPFLSTSERKLGTGAAADLPGPGYYSGDAVPHRTYSGKPSDVFRSETRRFQAPQAKNITPGPGTYLGHEEFGNKDKGLGGNFKAESDRIKWVRVPTAPSIPGREQSYGYEEGEQGELVMQGPLDLGHSGRGDDRPGPVDYNPRVEFTRRQSAAIDFSKGEDRSVILSRTRASTTPGPGHYNAAKGLGAVDEDIHVRRGIRRKRQRPTASFHHGSKRDRLQSVGRQGVSPGPGDYTVPSGLDVKRDPCRKDLSFLSTSRRFDDPAMGNCTNKNNRAPGPGSYISAPSDFDRWRTLFRTRHRTGPAGATSQNAPIGFQSTTLRFADDLPRNNELGPAAYNPGGMADEVNRKGAGRRGGAGGAFGSTSRRFPVESAGQQNMPGPGYYDLEVDSVSAVNGDGRGGIAASSSASVAGKRLPGALSCFASASKRFGRPSSADAGPAPGQYEVRQVVRARGIPAIGKQSKNRFEYLTKNVPDGIGPGSYNIRDVEKMGRVHSRKKIMVSSQERFKDPSARKSDVPGPGHYGWGSGHGNLIKQTYNIVIAEQSADI